MRMSRLLHMHFTKDSLGVGVTKPIFSVPLFSRFSVIVKKTLAIEYRVYIWQLSPQLSCGDTCQIWRWFMEWNRYFCKIENFAYGEISERSFSNPHLKSARDKSVYLSHPHPGRNYLAKFSRSCLQSWINIAKCGHQKLCSSWMITCQIRIDLFPHRMDQCNQMIKL